MKKKLKIAFLGDVVTEPFNSINKYLDFHLEFYHHGIDQIFQTLIKPFDGDVLIIHLTSDYFFEDNSRGEAKKKIDDYYNAVNNFAKSNSCLLVINTLEFLRDNIIGVDYFKDLDFHYQINSKIISLAEENNNISLIDIQRIISEIGLEKFYNLKNRLMFRMPYTKQSLDRIIFQYAASLEERFKPRKKVLLLDADNTLWGGIVGEDGVDGVSINNDYPGIIFRRFQRQILDIHNSGILLVMITKNNIEEIDGMFSSHDMPLKKENFIKIFANWEPKSSNILKTSKELNLGIDSFIYIDDNIFEIEEVKSVYPEIQSHRFDYENPEKSLNILKNIKGFRSWSLSKEDLIKTSQYQDEKKREIHRAKSPNINNYLLSLEMKLEFGVNRISQIKRISSLTNKTNQFNLTTNRYSEIDIENLIKKNYIFDFRLTDRFGDMGVVGVVIVIDNNIDTFLLSCRALGRKIEVQMLKVIYDKFKNNLKALYVPSKKNNQVKIFFESNGFLITKTDIDGTKRYKMETGPSENKFIKISEVI